ncbi:MAG: 1-acyl-sn-glycerol-3-phosphate acyltransferase [Bacteroidales bacterium]|jgi:1-acyl-sn-glycerol-3-phosphate acyltransferase|nr:1-acyl-sn-glycerol-3-phosphate acyltransferase [Bacteroidales bacterium]
MNRRQRFFLRLFHRTGWKFVGEERAVQTWKDMEKCVLIVAPHTAIVDYTVGYLALLALGKKAKFLINKKFFFFPLGAILRTNGGIPVALGKNKNFLKNITEYFAKSPRMFLVVTPEGTRKKVNRWRKGFYQIAQETGVPVLLGALDFKKKEVKLGDAFPVSGNFNADMKEINKFYAGVSGKYPKRFALHGEQLS